MRRSNTVTVRFSDEEVEEIEAAAKKAMRQSQLTDDDVEISPWIRAAALRAARSAG